MTKAKRKPRKKATSPQPYFESTISLREGYGMKGAKPRPFNAEKALREFRHWAYAAAMMNANAVANVPLRLYARKRQGVKAFYGTRPVKGLRLKYLAEHASETVVRKVAEFGSDVVEIVEPHPILEVLKTVNPWQRTLQSKPRNTKNARRYWSKRKSTQRARERVFPVVYRGND